MKFFFNRMLSAVVAGIVVPIAVHYTQELLIPWLDHQLCLDKLTDEEIKDILGKPPQPRATPHPAADHQPAHAPVAD